MVFASGRKSLKKKPFVLLCANKVSSSPICENLLKTVQLVRWTISRKMAAIFKDIFGTARLPVPVRRLLNSGSKTRRGEPVQRFHRHSHWLYIQQQISSSSSNRFIEHWQHKSINGSRGLFRKLGRIPEEGPEFPGQNVVFNKTIAGRRRTLLLSSTLVQPDHGDFPSR